MIKTYYVLFVFLSYHSLSIGQIHVFGDSHASFCFSNDRTQIPRDEISIFKYIDRQKIIPIPFYIHWLGSKTMFGIGRDGLNALDLKKFGVQNNDVAVFVFGEIDARCHIGKQRDLKNRELSEVIQTLAYNFLETIQKNRLAFQQLHCVIVSVTPPTNNAYNWVYPYHGTLEDRAIITRLLNAQLKEQCLQYNINFLDIYPLYATTDGVLDDKVSDGVVHVNPIHNDQIKQKLIDLLLTKSI